MTSHEIKNLTDEINSRSAAHILVWKVRTLYSSLVKSGALEEAHTVLRLLRRGQVKLYLDDISWSVQCMLEDIGVRVNYSRNGNTATAYLAPAL